MKALHTCIRVKDLDQSVAFYTSAFPFKENYRKDFPDSQFTLVYLALEGESYELELTYNYGHGDYDLGNGYGHIALGSEHFEADHKNIDKQVFQLPISKNWLTNLPAIISFRIQMATKLKSLI